MKIKHLVKVYRRHAQDSYYLIIELPKGIPAIVYLTPLEYRCLAVELQDSGIQATYEGGYLMEKITTYTP